MKPLFSISIFIALTLASPTRASTWDDCLADDAPVSLAACSAIIDAKTESAQKLALAYYNRGFAHAQQSEDDLAVSDYTQSVNLDPTNFDVFNKRGFRYLDGGHYDLALADFDKAIALTPDQSDVHAGRGVALKNLKKYDDAL